MKTSREREQGMAPTSKSSGVSVQNSERGAVVLSAGALAKAEGRGADPAVRGAQYPTSNVQFPIAGGTDRRRGSARGGQGGAGGAARTPGVSDGTVRAQAAGDRLNDQTTGRRSAAVNTSGPA